ncbi:endospore germination permease [Paenibacillus sp. A3]|uniref:GerAB/ArcD/ProY family transporter n=1 Tax=Paenibacillus sp. A3 TaxID=1337054 RepID=UPI0006D5953D|nr:endospore germination permease [Paenibacillus sp. A3]
MARINKSQLFSLILLFELGSTTLFALGIEAKQDAWIAILIATAIGLGLLWVYLSIQTYYPNQNLGNILIDVLGKAVGIPLVLLYGLYFFLIGSTNLWEFTAFIQMIILPTSPLLVLLFIVILTAVYVLSLGVEVLARTSEIVLGMVLFFIVTAYILVASSGEAEWSQLLPVLGHGFKPVIKAAVPTIVNFPFGEMVVFFMYWHFASTKFSIKPPSFWAVGISGLMLSISLVAIISVLGVEFAANSTIPIFIVIKTINIAEILTNLDFIAVIIMFIGGFYKMTIFFYGSVQAFNSVVKFRRETWLILFLGILSVCFSYIFFTSFSFHRWVGTKVFIPYVHMPFQVFMPILLLLIVWLKHEKNSAQRTAGGSLKKG